MTLREEQVGIAECVVVGRIALRESRVVAVTFRVNRHQTSEGVVRGMDEMRGRKEFLPLFD